jgi:hypothetical protein
MLVIVGNPNNQEAPMEGITMGHPVGKITINPREEPSRIGTVPPKMSRIL